MEQFDRSADDTVCRLALFYRSAVCKVELDLGLIVKAAYEVLFDHVGTLAHRAWLDDKVLCEEYDLLLIRIDLFEDRSRRLAKVFRAAFSNLDSLPSLQSCFNMERDLMLEQQSALRTMKLCCLAFVGINHFEKVNDGHGHLLGD